MSYNTISYQMTRNQGIYKKLKEKGHKISHDFKKYYFCIHKGGISSVVEHNLAKVGVAGSIPVSRSSCYGSHRTNGYVIVFFNWNLYGKYVFILALLYLLSRT